MNILEKRILAEIAQGPAVFGDQRPDAELTAAFNLRTAGLAINRGSGLHTITEEGMAALGPATV